MGESNFEWDEDKNTKNKQKHNVSFEDAQYAFFDPKRIITEDSTHSHEEEKRYFCIGQDKAGEGILTVRFTYRSNRIRIIGAGYWREGKRSYEQKNPIY